MPARRIDPRGTSQTSAGSTCAMAPLSATTLTRVPLYPAAAVNDRILPGP